LHRTAFNSAERIFSYMYILITVHRLRCPTYYLIYRLINKVQKATIGDTVKLLHENYAYFLCLCIHFVNKNSWSMAKLFSHCDSCARFRQHYKSPTTAGMLWVLKHLPEIKGKTNLISDYTMTKILWETTAFASVCRFRLTEIGRHLQPPDMFSGRPRSKRIFMYLKPSERVCWLPMMCSPPARRTNRA